MADLAVGVLLSPDQEAYTLEEAVARLAPDQGAYTHEVEEGLPVQTADTFPVAVAYLVLVVEASHRVPSRSEEVSYHALARQRGPALNSSGSHLGLEVRRHLGDLPWVADQDRVTRRGRDDRQDRLVQVHLLQLLTVVGSSQLL